MAEDVYIYKDYFYKLEVLINNLSVGPEEIYNIDECGFRISIGGKQDMITMEAFRVWQAPTETNRDFITMTKCINATGKTIPPLCILKGTQILYQHVTEALDLTLQMLLSVTKSGYSNDQIAFYWIKHFNKFTRQRGS